MYSTKEILQNYIETAKGKVASSFKNTLLLSMMAGIFIALAGVGCCFSTYYTNFFVGACVFPAGLVMVLMGGGKLFTGDCLLTIPVLTGDVRLSSAVKTLVLVYIGNFIGAVLIALLMVYSNSLAPVKEAVLQSALHKAEIPFLEAFLKGILCNILVCVSVWLSFSTRSAGEKALLIYLPILVFVIAGFEHCVANMYFLPAGIFTALKYGSSDLLPLLLSGLYKNLVPVTLGNILGGVLVGMMYKFSSYKKANQN